MRDTIYLDSKDVPQYLCGGYTSRPREKAYYRQTNLNHLITYYFVSYLTLYKP